MEHELEIPKGVLVINGLTEDEFDKLINRFGDLFVYRMSIAMFGREIDFEFRKDNGLNH